MFIFHIVSSHISTNTHLCLILHQDILLDPKSEKQFQEAWVGDWFSLFYAVVIGYFVADLIWVILVPKCVKSPVSQFILMHFYNSPMHRLDSNHLVISQWQGVIIQHHVATLLYLLFPYIYPGDSWLMGACLIVEINTWLLIARRVFNKQGFTPWVRDLSGKLSSHLLFSG